METIAAYLDNRTKPISKLCVIKYRDFNVNQTVRVITTVILKADSSIKIPSLTISTITVVISKYLLFIAML
jgi:hypothetical protein